MHPAPSLGLIVNTFNQPEYLGRVLRAISKLTHSPQEVLLADDGSEDETRQVFNSWAKAQSFRAEHVWQEHQGFRRARILNEAIARARNKYLVFLDGDTIPHPQFVSDHATLAQDGAFVQGHRALVERKAAEYFGRQEFFAERRRAVWQWQLRGLKHGLRWPWPLRRARRDLRGVRGCNLAIWRADLVRVNGYNEAFEGWGREDSELALRLMNSGLRRLDVRGWALCYHLWHAPASRTELNRNDELLEQAKREGSKWCELGLDGHKRNDQ
jgi:glycosyltransferase involved in cell wall biosynthesis